MAEVALAQQFWVGRLAALVYIVATAILNFALFESRLVPRVISGLGFVGLVGLALGMTLGVGDPTRSFQPGQLLVIPIIAWELTFATWLIVKGFAPASIPSSDDAEAPVRSRSLASVSSAR